MSFIVVYTIEAHPAGSNSPYANREWTAAYSKDRSGAPVNQPDTFEERMGLARKVVSEEGLELPVLVDEMDNPVWCTYGPAPNIAYLISTEGRIALRQPWYDVAGMEKAIRKLLGLGF